MKRLLKGLLVAVLVFAGVQVWAADTCVVMYNGIEPGGDVYTVRGKITTDGDTYNNTDVTFTLPFKAWLHNVHINPDVTAVPLTAFNFELRESIHNTDMCYNMTAACAVDAVTSGMPLDSVNSTPVIWPKDTVIIPFIDTTGVGDDVVYFELTFVKVGE